jgi:hypothetical protein
VGIDERWRDGVRVILRKRSKAQWAPQQPKETEEVLS